MQGGCGGAWVWEVRGPGQQQSDSPEVETGRDEVGDFFILPPCLTARGGNVRPWGLVGFSRP